MNAPPLFVGATLVFWGAVCGQWMLAIPAAIVLEGSRWVGVRWQLTDNDFRRLADLCNIGIIGIVVYRLFTGWFNQAAWMVIKWLPIVLLPLILGQAYSVAGRINLNTLLLLKWKRPADPDKPPIFLDISYAYAGVCVLAAGAANLRTAWFYPAIIVLLSWGMWPYRPRRRSVLLWAGLFIPAAVLGAAGHMGLSHLQGIVMEQTIGLFSGLPVGNAGMYRNFSKIGDIGNHKVSNRIVFRLKPASENLMPSLLQEGAYDVFRSDLTIWSASRTEFQAIDIGAAKGTWQVSGCRSHHYVGTIAQHLRGENEMLKLSGGACRLTNLDVVSAETNGLGTVKVEGVGLRLYRIHDSVQTPLMAPPTRYDREFKGHEADTVEQIIRTLKLRSMPPEKRLNVLNSWFTEHFTYSLETQPRKSGISLIENFLTHSRAGHCELFATAAAVILRSTGIPTRYVRGYAVDPSDRMGGWILVRSRHAHAWVSAYIGEKWTTMDPTPGNWQAMESSHMPWIQKLKDMAAWLTFSFSQWQDQWSADRRGSVYISLLFLLIFLLFAYRVWRKRTRTRSASISVERRISGSPPPLPGLDSDFYRIEKQFNSQGFFRHRWETFSDWFRRMEESHKVVIPATISKDALDLHNRSRFDVNGLTGEEKEKLGSIVSDCTEKDIRTAFTDLRGHR